MRHFAALISLSTIVLLVIIFHLYARCVLRRQAHRCRQAFLERIPSLGLTTSGDSLLVPMVINSLPIFRFKKTTQLSEIYHNDKSTECSVCLTMLENEEMARFLPNCRHIFHAECIDKWLALHSTCHLCRIEAEPRIKPDPREGPSIAIVDSSASPLAEHSLDTGNSLGYGVEGTTDDEGGHYPPLRSMSRVQSCGEEHEGHIQDLERQ